MSIVLHSNAVQTAAWYYKTATIIDWANDVPQMLSMEIRIMIVWDAAV
jgi:predicted chitinase